ncbi:MAG: D-alanyl-D-alanine carboxypeptidase, partial [SAR324 cluster bacterium]|nr:D-alanyl-D-alanine carboxypeptidase [SAR324 cluster bacterium]
QSANDAATAIAEYIGGSVEGFVLMMNEEAEKLGMTNTVFQTPHGLPPSAGQADDLTTSRDMATLGRALLSEFPELTALTGKIDGDFRNGTFKLHNHNNLLRHYDGCDGIKTGFHNGAGFCITASAVRNNIRMITSVMGCNSIKSRTEEASRLLSQGFAQYRLVKLIDDGAPVNQMVPVIKGKKKEVMPVAAKRVTGVVRISNADKVEQIKELCSELKAPVVKDTPCGQIRFLVNGHEVGRVDAVVREDIPKATLTERFWNLF